jgi:hypothetical protein
LTGFRHAAVRVVGSATQRIRTARGNSWSRHWRGCHRRRNRNQKPSPPKSSRGTGATIRPGTPPEQLTWKASNLEITDDSKADASVTEDKILELFEQADKAKGEIEQEKSRLKEEETVFNEHKNSVEERVKQIDQRLAQLEAQRKQILPGIEPKILKQYERILNNRDGLAIVSVKDNSCKGCNMFVPPQVINLIKMYERIITCEICNRILYIADEPS